MAQHTEHMPRDGLAVYADALERIPPSARRGRLTSRPQAAPARAAEALAPGVHRLPGGRSAALVVPPGYRPERPAPLLVVFHGAGGNARRGLDVLERVAGETGTVALAPESQGATWDLVLGRVGPDVARLDLALAALFERYAIDPARVGACGASDGASYALTLGLTNGDLFRHVVAFSPGFAAPREVQGRPRVFISHGRADPVLDVERCSRRLVARLREAGYPVEYLEFEGGHSVPPAVLEAAVAWVGERPAP